MPAKVAITGAGGLLGTAAVTSLSERFDVFGCALSRGAVAQVKGWSTFDLLESEKLVSWLRSVRPDVVVHCAALVDVDYCERNPAFAERLHVDATMTIASTLKEWDGRLIYISTDSVFDGHKRGRYCEDDQPLPLNTYALTKYKGEQVALRLPTACVLRANIFGWTRDGRPSFAEWVLSVLREERRQVMFTDVTYTPIHVSHLTDVIRALIDTPSYGIFHAGSVDIVSKYEFGLLMASVFDLSARQIEPGSIRNSALHAPRPKNTALAADILESVISWNAPEVAAGVALMRHQWESGWVSAIRRQPS